jgi:hypothetical protein
MGLVHALVVGAAVTGFLLILLWAGEAVGIAPLAPELRAMLLGATEHGPREALRGVPMTLALGAVIGVSIAFFANLLSFLDRT